MVFRALGFAVSALAWPVAAVLGVVRYGLPHGTIFDYGLVGGRVEELQIKRDIEGRNPRPRDPAP